MRNALRNLLFLIIVSFMLIILLSMVYNQLSIQARSKHEEVLSTAYDQRMTIQKIVLQVSLVGDNSLDLSSQVQQFNRYLVELKNLGDVPWLVGDLLIHPAIIHPNYDPDLVEISKSWSIFVDNWTAFKKITPTDPSYGKLRWNVIDSLTLVLTQVDSFSNTLEGLEAEQNQNQSKAQFTFLGLGLIVVAWGGYVINRRVIRPLSYLESVMMQFGQGKLTQPIFIRADDEFGHLAHSFENMRQEISASQKELEERVKNKTLVLTTAFEFSQEIVSQPDLSKIIQSVSQRAKDLMHAKHASLCLISDLNPEKNRLSKRTTGSLIRAANASSSKGSNHCAVCVKHENDPTEVMFSTNLKIGELNIGYLCVTRDRRDPFSEMDIHTIKLLANSTAVVIANIHLIESERREAELNATLNERQRIASELHDEAAQTLSLLNLKITELEGFTNLKKEEALSSALPEFNVLIEKAQSQMRMAFSGMNAPVVSKGGNLSSELENYLMEFEKSTKISIELLMDDLSSIRIPAMVQKQIAYIYREALTNAKRYSQAKNIKVHLQNVDQGIYVALSDDGVGFDPNISRSDHHFGLSVMQMRTERIGGALVIETAPGKGTRVAAFIPLGVEGSTALAEMEQG
ncbi:MAG: HAMP domain-containing protein [Chloroflexi bacterium]|nr:HAMP domain-containing protein [Chloroflexota bacterium]